MPKIQPLRAADIAWLRMEAPTNPMTIVGLLVFSEPMRIADLRRLITERLLIFERFRQKIVGGTHWVTDELFDLDAHLHRAALPAPGDKRVLEAYVGELMSQPLDLSKPPWQFHLVEDYDGGSALVARLHHAIGDGIALVRVLLSLADEFFETFDHRQIPSYGREPAPRSFLESLFEPVGKTVTGLGRVAAGALGGAFELVRRPGQVFEWAKASMSVGAAASRIALLPSDSETRFKGQVGVTKRVAWSGPIPLDDVKAVGAGAGAKVNDVLLAAVAGGLRRYLLAQGDPVDGVELGSVIPVNLRPLSRAFELGNEFGIVFLSLPVGIASASERLREVTRRMELIKASAEPAVAFAILQAIGAGPMALHREVTELLSAKCSAVMTNVPGPTHRLHLLGRPLSHIMFWVPRAGNIGLGVSIISYAGTVRIGIATDVRMAPDPRAIVAGLHEEFDALREEFGAAPAARPGQRKRRRQGTGGAQAS